MCAAIRDVRTTVPSERELARWPPSCARRASTAARAAAVLREASVVAEAGRYACARSPSDRRTGGATPYAGRAAGAPASPVILVPGFLAGRRDARR